MRQTAQAPPSVASSANVRLGRLDAQPSSTVGCQARHLAGHDRNLGRKYSNNLLKAPEALTHRPSVKPPGDKRRSSSSIGSSSSSSQAGQYEYWDNSSQAEAQQYQGGWSSWRSFVQTGMLYHAWCFAARRLEDAAQALCDLSPRALDLSFQQAELIVKAGAALVTLLVIRSVVSLLWNVLLVGIVVYVALRISSRSRQQEDLSRFFSGGRRWDADAGGDGLNGPRSDLVDVWFVQPSDPSVSEGGGSGGSSRRAPRQPSAAFPPGTRPGNYPY